MNLLSVSYIQTHLIWHKAEENRRRFEALIKAEAPHTNLIVLPEMFTTGFSMEATRQAEAFDTHLQWFKKMVQSYQVAITGSVMCHDQGKFYNRLVFMKPDASFSTYDKAHLFSLAKEQDIYTSGQKPCIVSYKSWKINLQICYDLRFPVWSRNTSDYDLLIYVANWPEKRITAWDALLKARAIENMTYCIGVNRIGQDGNQVNYVGHSAGYDYLGRQISTHEPSQAVVERLNLSYQEQQDARHKFGFLKDRDSFSLS